jgi:hypothetical protein
MALTFAMMRNLETALTPAQAPDKPGERPLSPDSTGPASARAEIWKERLERVFFDAGGFHGQMIEYAARTALPIVLWACDAASPSAREPLAVIEFAQTMDDQGEMREFLRSWSEGDTSEWPEFVKFLTALTPSAPIAAPVRETIERAWKDGAYWAQAEARNADAWLMMGASAERYALGVLAEDAATARVDGARRPVVEDDITQAMIQAGRHAANLNDGTLAGIYLAMVNAAPAGDVPGEAQTQAARDVLAERRRQVEAEGWTPEHDAEHSRGEMATAAACYCYVSPLSEHARLKIANEGAPYRWPWDASWWKPSNARRDLVKAGALILAEIERLDRSSGEAQTQEGGR